MSTNESDPLLELRDELNDEDEPLFAAAPKKATGAFSAPASPPVPATAAYGSAAPANGHATTNGTKPSGPPPLPTRRTAVSGVPGASPPTPANGAIVDPLRARTTRSPVTNPAGTAVPAAKVKGNSGKHAAAAMPTLPPTVARPPPGTDPFQEPAEPRLPAGADVEEKLKTFRTIIKAKDEALGRARSLYGAVDSEAQQLRLAAIQLRTQLEGASAELERTSDLPQQLQLLKDMLEKDTVRADVAEKKIDELIARLAEGDAERKDLTNALAEVEQQHQDLAQRLDDERRSREQLADELIGAKEALAHAHDRVGELATQVSEAEGNRSAFEDQAQQFSQECLTLSQKVSALEAELGQVIAERDQLRSDHDTLALELDTERRRGGSDGAALVEATQRLAALESEHEWSKSTLEQSANRVAELEQLAGEAKRDRDLAQAQISVKLQQISALDNQLKEAQKTTREAEARAASLEAQVRETQSVARGQLGSLQQQIQAQQGRANNLEAQLNEANARYQQLEASHHAAAGAKSAKDDAEFARARDDVAQLQASVAEANGNAEASQLALQASDARNTELEAQNEQLVHRVAQLDARLRATEERASKAYTAQAQSAELAEMQQVAEMRATAAENRLKDLSDRLKAAETRAAQQEARASQAEARQKDFQAKANSASAAEGKARAAEAKAAEFEQRVKGLQGAERELANMQAQEIQLKLRITALEQELKKKLDDDPDLTAPGIDALDAGAEKLKAENAALKKKLMAAETAIEAAASLKARVAKLEAQLKTSAKK